jgi:type I restriction enzyme S subunit
MKEPKIRFKGFSGEWKDLPFSEIADRTSSTGKTGSLPGIEFEDIVSGEGCLNKDVYQKDCRKYGKIFREGDILFGKLRPYLKNILLAEFRGIAIGDFWILRPCDNDSKFIYNLVNSEAFMRVANVSSGSKMPRADWNLVSSTRFFLPQDKVEQEAIGKYFTSLDAQISASTSRLASLKQMKAASLQAMFPQEGETVPKVRFKGFEEEWKKVKLSECLEISTTRNLNNEYGVNEVLSVSDEEGVMNQIKLLGRSYAGKSVTNYKILRTNQVVYTKSPLKAKPYGIVKVNKGETGIVSVLYAVYDAKECVSPDYIHYYFEPTFRINNYLLPLINKGAKNTMNISDEVSLQGDIILPNTLEEQLRIVEYLQSLDRQIALHTQRLEKLKQIKATCLDKMFV